MVEKLKGRSKDAISFRRSAKGYCEKSNLGAGARAWITRRANQNNTPIKQTTDKLIKSKLGFKFILNGVPVTIGADVKNAHVGVDRIEINF